MLLHSITGCCCQSAVCAMKLGCWCCCRCGCKMSIALWALGRDGDCMYAVAKKYFVATKNIFGYLGSMLAQFLSSVGCPIFWHQTVGTPFSSLRAGVVPPGRRQVNITPTVRWTKSTTFMRDIGINRQNNGLK